MVKSQRSKTYRNLKNHHTGIEHHRTHQISTVKEELGKLVAVLFENGQSKALKENKTLNKLRCKKLDDLVDNINTVAIYKWKKEFNK